MNQRITWFVTEVYAGSDPDLGIHDGGREVVASGEVIKDGHPEDLRRELTKALEAGFPRHGLGGTYNIDRIYNIEITEEKT